MSSDVSKLIARVRKFVQSRKRVKFRLSLRAGLSENTLKDCDKPGWNPRVDTLQKVIEAIEEIEKEESRRPAKRVLRAQLEAA